MNEYLANSDVYSEREEKLQMARFCSRGNPTPKDNELVQKMWKFRRTMNTALGKEIDNILRSLDEK